MMHIASDVGDGLRFAHSANPCLVHGNVVPANVLLCSLGERVCVFASLAAIG